VGDVRFVARATPGHTFEHLAWDAHVGVAELPGTVFTGGSLLVGSAGRSDLLGEDLAERLARLQYRSVRELARLPSTTRILPTHGAGSFCVSNLPSADRVSTIGAELATNACLVASDEETFVREQLASLGRFPAYYARMAPINRAGPPILGRLPEVGRRTPAEVESLVAGGAWVVDGRDRDEFAAGHLPGAVNIELNEAFGTYVGWLLPFRAPLVLVLPDPFAESVPEATVQLARIGWDDTAGLLAGGVEAWAASGRGLRSYPVTTMRELVERRFGRGEPIGVLDVRQPQEWRDDGAVPGSHQIFVADLAARLDELPADEELWVVCTTGHRAAIGASLLDRAGMPVRLVGRGGTVGWMERILSSVAAVGGPTAA
jgi:rhodanese-related sulfurtransferase